MLVLEIKCSIAGQNSNLFVVANYNIVRVIHSKIEPNLPVRWFNSKSKPAQPVSGLGGSGGFSYFGTQCSSLLLTHICPFPINLVNFLNLNTSSYACIILYSSNIILPFHPITYYCPSARQFSYVIYIFILFER